MPNGLDDFLLEGGDELMNSEQCPKCGASIYLDQPIEWVDEAEGIWEFSSPLLRTACE